MSSYKDRELLQSIKPMQLVGFIHQFIDGVDKQLFRYDNPNAAKAALKGLRDYFMVLHQRVEENETFWNYNPLKRAWFAFIGRRV